MRPYVMQLAKVIFVASAVSMLASLTVRADQAPAMVVFVCEHGSSKSVVAAELFNQAASRRGVPLRALSRAVSAKTLEAKVPSGLARNLDADGFNVATYEPRPLMPEEAGSAARVVVVNYEGSLEAAGGVAVEHWNEIPPVTLEYEKAKKEMSARIDALLDSLTRNALTTKQ
jgi:arsenate reductase (thioredoxin)